MLAAGGEKPLDGCIDGQTLARRESETRDRPESGREDVTFVRKGDDGVVAHVVPNSMSTAETGRTLAWPAAALLILAVSVALWGLIGMLAYWVMH